MADSWIVPSVPAVPPAVVPPVAVTSSIRIDPESFRTVITPASPPSFVPAVVLPPEAVMLPDSVIAPAPVECSSTSPPAVP